MLTDAGERVVFSDRSNSYRKEYDVVGTIHQNALSSDRHNGLYQYSHTTTELEPRKATSQEKRNALW